MTLRRSSAALASALALSSVIPLGGCGSTPGSPSSTASNVSGYGVVQSVDVVQGQASSNALGTIAGAVVGGVIGNQIGGGTGNTVATVAGAAGGAYAGHEIQKNRNSGQAEQSYRITVKMDDGVVQSFTQSSPPAVKAGDHVRVENGVITGRR